MPLGNLPFTEVRTESGGNCSYGSIPKAPVHDSTQSYQHASTASNWSTNQEPLCSAIQQLDVESESELGGSAQQPQTGAGSAQQPSVPTEEPDLAIIEQAPQQHYVNTGASAGLIPVYRMVPMPFYIIPDTSTNGTFAFPNGQSNNPTAAAGTLLGQSVEVNSFGAHSQERRLVPMLNNRSVTYSEMCNALQELQMDPMQLLQYWNICKVDTRDSDAVEVVPGNQMQAPCRNRSRSKTSRVPVHHNRSNSKRHPGQTKHHQSNESPTQEELENRVSKRETGLANVLGSKFYKKVECALGKAQLPPQPQAPNLQNVTTISKRMWEDQLHGFRDDIRKKYAALQLAEEGFDRISAEDMWQKVMEEYEGHKKPSVKPEDGETAPDKVEQLWDKFMEETRRKLRMQQLREMGFDNEDAMLLALKRSAGDVGLAVDILTQ